MGLIALGLVLWTVALRIPLIGNPIDVSPDGCEYLGIARHLAQERRWESSIKWHFFTDEPVVHPALADRPPLYPLWAALWVGNGANGEQIYRARLANVALAAAVVVAALALLRTMFPFAVAFSAALLFATYPAFVRNGAQPLTEPLFLLFLLSAFHTFLVPRRRPFFTGALSGLAFLTRPAGALLLLTFGAELLLEGWRGRGIANCKLQIANCKSRSPGAQGSQENPASPDRETLGSGTAQFANCNLQFAICNPPSLRALLSLTAGFLLVCLPYWLAVWKQYGDPFHSVLSYNFSIGHIYEGTFYGFERRFPSPAEFIRENPVRVARLVWEQTANLALALLRSLRYLWPLAFLLRWEDVRRHHLILTFAALNFAFHALSWVVWGAARYQFPGYLFLAAVLIEAPLRRLAQARPPWLAGAVAGAAVAASLGACGLGTARLFREKLAPDAGVRLGWAVREAAEWLNAHPSLEPALCAANDPAILNLLTRRPAIVLPRLRDSAQVRRFLDRYRPGVLVLMVDERAEVEAGDVLLQPPWEARRVRPALAQLMDAEIVRSRPRPPDAAGPRMGSASPAQWLIVLRVRPAGSAGRRHEPIREGGKTEKAGYNTTDTLAHGSARRGTATAASVSPEYGLVPRNAAATPHLRGALPADDRRVYGTPAAVWRRVDQGRAGSRRAGGAS